jgi:iron complex outermembrane receptor protein
LTDTLIVRAAASRVVSRPTLTDLSPAQSITAFIVDQPVNGKGASVQGLELSYRTVFNRLPSPLDGLGSQVSYTYTDSNANYVNEAKAGATSYTLQGLSKNSFTFVGFYEKGPVQARVSYTWRDHYLVLPQTQTGVPQFSDRYKQL